MRFENFENLPIANLLKRGKRAVSDKFSELLRKFGSMQITFRIFLSTFDFNFLF